MSDDTKDKKIEAEELDLNTAFGRFMNNKQNPESPAYFLDGLLSQTDPRLKNKLLEDYKHLFGVVDIVDDLMKKIMSTPQGQREFAKEVDKFVSRRQTSEIKKEAPDGQEDT